MRPFWCRLFGCSSLFAWVFRWPHRLCMRAVDKAENDWFDEVVFWSDR